MLQFRGRVDYNITQSTKLYVSYNHQHDNALNSLDVLWGSGGNSWGRSYNSLSFSYSRNNYV